MPPVSKAPLAAKYQLNFNDLSTSQDTDSPPVKPEPEPEILSRTSKKKKKSRQAATEEYPPPLPATQTDKKWVDDTISEDDPPHSAIVKPIAAIPRSFLALQSKGSSSHNQDVTQILEKVSDQHIPHDDSDLWPEDCRDEQSHLVQPHLLHEMADDPPAQPNFEARGGFSSKSPPVSPRQKLSRPVSYASAIYQLPDRPRTSSSPYSAALNLPGSPPAPHLPQPHFYHAQDVDLRLPKALELQEVEQPTLVKYTRIPQKYGKLVEGVLVGYDGKLVVAEIDNGNFKERGTIAGFSGKVIDAILLPPGEGQAESSDRIPSAIMVIHVPTHGIQFPGNEHASTTNPAHHTKTRLTTTNYTTRVEVRSFVDHTQAQTLLQTPSISVQSAVRGISHPEPEPVGCLRLYVSDGYLAVASGVSGEVFVFSFSDESSSSFVCIDKLWTSVQPQARRRESSHGRASDTDVSPADSARGSRSTDRAIVDMSGRWLALAPASVPSRSSLGAIVDPSIEVRRHVNLDSTSAPARPAITCEIDSPDNDTLLGKVARGVAQELVKGAKWLGDQSYQTWQSYWRKDQSPSVPPSHQHPRFSPPSYPGYHVQNTFPPTHGDAVQSTQVPELVSIIDLRMLEETATKRSPLEPKPLATFLPPQGCSFLSFSPHGLSLFTAGRKGDVLYVWDLMQIRHGRTSPNSHEEDKNVLQPCVRQITRQDRSSTSTVIDVVWDGLTGNRFAVLTKNKTVHLYDLPRSALRWPPPASHRSKPERAKVSDQASSTNPPETASGSGFLASAINIANKAQPIMSGWRGRAPSLSGGLAGIGATGIGLASATGVKGGKVVAAGLSKSLGAASETVNSIRHASDSRLHLRMTQEPVPGRLFWSKQRSKCVLVVLDEEIMKHYHIRKTRPHEKRSADEISVFDARKAIVTKLPLSNEFLLGLSNSAESDGHESPLVRWKANEQPKVGSAPHPLSLAEIDTNAPYQPFHTDRRVTISCFAEQGEAHGHQQGVVSKSKRSCRGQDTVVNKIAWVFGGEIATQRLEVGTTQISNDEDDDSDSVMHRETTIASSLIGDRDAEQITSSTRRSKKKRSDNARSDKLVTLYQDEVGMQDDFGMGDDTI